MLTKVLVIARNAVYLAFQDRVALMFMFLAPLGLSLVMGFAFGGDDGDISLPKSDILVVNLDRGELGKQYEDILTNPVENDLDSFIGSGKSESDPDRAIEKVENGDVRAALIIPPDFSETVTSPGQQVELQLHYNPGSQVGATIVIAIVEGITNGFNNVFVAQNILVAGENSYFTGQLQLSPEQAGQALGEVTQRLVSDEARTVITLNQINVESNEGFDPLSYFAPSMAILFMTFTMAAGTRAVLEEQQNWTLQRILSTPTPRWVYLAGRLLGTYVTGILQMTILLFATPLVALMTGGNADVWGTNYAGIGLMTVAVVFAGTGLGLLIAAASNSVKQADITSTGVLFLLAMAGGSFIPVESVPVVKIISRFTLNFWGLSGYFELATENAALGGIAENVFYLALMGVVFFLFSLWRFNRRLNF